MKAIRDPQSPQGEEVPMGDANTNANTTTGAQCRTSERAKYEYSNITATDLT